MYGYGTFYLEPSETDISPGPAPSEWWTIASLDGNGGTLSCSKQQSPSVVGFFNNLLLHLRFFLGGLKCGEKNASLYSLKNYLLLWNTVSKKNAPRLFICWQKLSLFVTLVGKKIAKTPYLLNKKMVSLHFNGGNPVVPHFPQPDIEEKKCLITWPVFHPLQKTYHFNQGPFFPLLTW